MLCARQVIIIVGTDDFTAVALPLHEQQGDHIRLFDDLRLRGNAIGAAPILPRILQAGTHRVHRGIFQGEIPVKLLYHAILARILAHKAFHRLPVGGQLGGEAELFVKLGIVDGMLACQPCGGVQRALPHETSHFVGIGVVVHMLVILVGANHIPQFIRILIDALDQQTMVKARRFHQHLCSTLQP